MLLQHCYVIAAIFIWASAVYQVMGGVWWNIQPGDKCFFPKGCQNVHIIFIKKSRARVTQCSLRELSVVVFNWSVTLQGLIFDVLTRKHCSKSSENKKPQRSPRIYCFNLIHTCNYCNINIENPKIHPNASLTCQTWQKTQQRHLCLIKHCPNKEGIKSKVIRVGIRPSILSPKKRLLMTANTSRGAI